MELAQGSLTPRASVKSRDWGSQGGACGAALLRSPTSRKLGYAGHCRTIALLKGHHVFRAFLFSQYIGHALPAIPPATGLPQTTTNRLPQGRGWWLLLAAGRWPAGMLGGCPLRPRPSRTPRIVVSFVQPLGASQGFQRVILRRSSPRVQAGRVALESGCTETS